MPASINFEASPTHQKLTQSSADWAGLGWADWVTRWRNHQAATTNEAQPHQLSTRFAAAAAGDADASASTRPKSVNPITCSSAGIFCDMFHNSMRVSLSCASSHCCQRMLRWPHTHTHRQLCVYVCVCVGDGIAHGVYQFASAQSTSLSSSDPGSTSVGPTHHVGRGRRHWHSLTRVYLAAAQAFDRRQ